jgi:hypothetical protein
MNAQASRTQSPNKIIGELTGHNTGHLVTQGWIKVNGIDDGLIEAEIEVMQVVAPAAIKTEPPCPTS